MYNQACFSFISRAAEEFVAKIFRYVHAEHVRHNSQNQGKRYATALILCSLTCFHCALPNLILPHSADPPVIRLQGGCIAPPAPNENIRLDVVHVTIRCMRDWYSVDAVHHLLNTGETATETVGVPKFGTLEMHQDCHQSMEPVISDFLKFDAWVNGQKTEFYEVRDFFTKPSVRPVGGYCEKYGAHMCNSSSKTSETRWMTKKIIFAGGATTTIRIRYEARYHRNFPSGGYTGDYGYYHYSTGRLWKGNIGKLTFIIDITDIVFIGTPAIGWAKRQLTEKMTWYEIQDLEPAPADAACIWGTFAGTNDIDRGIIDVYCSQSR